MSNSKNVKKALNAKNVINAINKALEPFFSLGEGGSFILSQLKESNNIFRLRADGDCSMASDDYGNELNEVKVIKWFSDYWLFVEIKFLNPEGIIITLSVFQGAADDDSKIQLFRAEWDDYGDGNMNHPQPHWHFLSNKAIEKAVNGFVDIISDGRDTFNQLVQEEKSKTIDLSKFHFAMNGDWNNTTVHIHDVDDEKKLSQWFGGLLAYLRAELKYMDDKRGIKIG